MTKREMAALRMFRAARAWLAAQRDLTRTSTGSLTGIGRALARLSDDVRAIEAAGAAQERGTREIRGAARDIERRRKDLVSDELVHVATIARAVRVPAMVADLRIDHTRRSVEDTLAAAEAIARGAVRWRERLEQSGLRGDVAAAIRRAADAYRQASSDLAGAVAARTGATVAVHTGLQSARADLETATALLKRALRNDPARLAEWMHVRRIVQPR